MPAYSIPPGYRPGFRRFALLTRPQFAKFVDAVETCEPAADLSVVSERIAAATSLPNDEVIAMLAAIFSAAALRAREGMTPTEMGQSLAVSELELPSKASAQFADRTAQLLEIRNVRLIARAIDLAAAEEHVLLASRIVTDLRPVFPDPDTQEDPDGLAPMAGLVVHSLRLEYSEAGQIRTFVVSLDGADIARLREALDRADRKADGIGKLAAMAGLTNLSHKREAEG